ncbi:unnamed protein product [Symbiodinium natans]|uniref:Uncharacterized protein n=1 Tax=Symbiodinium natans TaxID=878477 RepID=A0A812UHU8_9DINO|nr:unnamed protein product [Symbiodinium natans]
MMAWRDCIANHLTAFSSLEGGRDLRALSAVSQSWSWLSCGFLLATDCIRLASALQLIRDRSTGLDFHAEGQTKTMHPHPYSSMCTSCGLGIANGTPVPLGQQCRDSVPLEGDPRLGALAKKVPCNETFLRGKIMFGN